MGLTGTGVTWPVRTCAGACDDCCDEPCISTRNVTDTYGPGYGLHTISVI